MKNFNALQLLLVKLHLLLIALAASTTAVYPVSPQKPSTARNLAIAVPFPPTPTNHPAADIYTLVPSLRPIAACESTGDKNGVPRQFNSDGSILWGRDRNASGTVVIVKRDCGEGQINTWAHGRYPNGLDVCGNEDDNVYEMYLLYEQRGLEPWIASEATCWGK